VPTLLWSINWKMYMIVCSSHPLSHVTLTTNLSWSCSLLSSIPLLSSICF
jgi:hypothetical protein